MSTYSATLLSNTGVNLANSVPVIEGECTLVERGIGTLSLSLPPTIPLSYLQKDGRILLRPSYGGTSQIEGDATWLIRRVRQVLSGRERRIEVGAVHANHLLSRRIVAYAASSSEAAKSGAADDLMKAVVRENFTAPTDTTRTMSGLTVASDLGAAPTIDKAFSRRNVLSVLQDLADAAAAAGTYLGFEVRTVGTSLVFLTYTQQRGVDRRANSGNYLRVSPSSGGIADSTLEYNWTYEATFVYSLGQGEQENRQIGTAQNTAAEGQSPFGRIEDSYQANQSTSQAQLDDDATAALYARRAIIGYEATSQDAPGFAYGINYGWGDFLTVSDFGAQFDVRVNPVNIRFGRQGVNVQNKFIYNNTGLAV